MRYARLSVPGPLSARPIGAGLRRSNLLLLCGFLLFLMGGCRQELATEPSFLPDAAAPGPGAARLTLTGVSPRAWPTAGEVEISLLGSGFSAAASVLIAGRKAPVVASTGDQLSVRLPPNPGAIGDAPISITNPNGESVRGDGLFSYSSARFTFPNESAFGGFIASRSLLLSDLNRDGKQDLIGAHFDGTIGIALGDGSGGFTLVNRLALPATEALIGADFNGDGLLDLAAVHSFDGFSVLLARTGTAFSAPTFHLGGRIRSLVAADMNGDQKIDLVLIEQSSRSVRVMFGDGTGQLTAGPMQAIPADPAMLLAADFNGDGKTDLVTANAQASICVLLNDGSGGLAAPTVVSTVDSPLGLTAADLNRDGKIDLIAASSIAVPPRHGIRVLLGDGRGGFDPPQTFPLDTTYPGGGSSGSWAMMTADLDRDGKLDVILGGTAVRVFPGDGAGKLGPLRSRSGAGSSGSPLALSDA
jgi:hypothetical protein